MRIVRDRVFYRENVYLGGTKARGTGRTGSIGRPLSGIGNKCRPDIEIWPIISRVGEGDFSPWGNNRSFRGWRGFDCKTNRILSLWNSWTNEWREDCRDNREISYSRNCLPQIMRAPRLFISFFLFLFTPLILV